MDHPCYSLISHPVISIPLDPFRSTWLASNLQQNQHEADCCLLATDTWHQFVCDRMQALPQWNKQLNITGFYVDIYLMTTISYPCAMYTLKSEQTSWHQSVYYLVFWNSLCCLDILQSPLYRTYMCEECQKCWIKPMFKRHAALILHNRKLEWWFTFIWNVFNNIQWDTFCLPQH